jgi:hypothetical protein
MAHYSRVASWADGSLPRSLVCRCPTKCRIHVPMDLAGMPAICLPCGVRAGRWRQRRNHFGRCPADDGRGQHREHRNPIWRVQNPDILFHRLRRRLPLSELASAVLSMHCCPHNTCWKCSVVPCQRALPVGVSTAVQPPHQDCRGNAHNRHPLRTSRDWPVKPKIHPEGPTTV